MILTNNLFYNKMYYLNHTFYKEITFSKGTDLIKNITGKPSTLYRGPYGEYNNTVINAADEQKHKTIQWNLDTLDYTRSNR